MRHVIIGSGIAGLAAAEAIRARDAAATIQMVSEEAHDFYSRPGLAYLLRGDIPEKQLQIRSTQDLRALLLQRLTGRVEQIFAARHEIQVDGGRRLPYDRLLLAPGARAVPPTFPGGDLAGVVKLDGLDDTRHILKLARRGKHAVVVGGGITALELAEGLRARGMEIFYLLRGKRYWSDVLDETESRIVMDRLRQDGIDLRTETQVKEARGAKGAVREVETDRGDRLPCDILAVAIGVRPRVELATQSGLKVEKGIVVNEYLETSAAHVFAAGDAAQVVDPVRGALPLDVLWPTALSQGRIAGDNMAGARQAHVKELPYNVTQLAGLRVTIIGAIGGGARNEDLKAITRGESELWRQKAGATVVSQRGETDRVRLVLGERHISGALVMGDQKWSRLLQRLITVRADLAPIRETLLKDAAPLERLAELYERIK
ncbi:MAG: FAD-dependent oxidoreductase [Gemmataceae bacterium]